MILLKDKEKLKVDMIQKGLTISALARKIGCSKATISGILHLVRNPSPKIAVKICEQLQKQFDEYFFVEGVHKKEQKQGR